MQEIWKYIDGYDGKYQVSNLGRIRSLHRNTTLIKALSKDSDGYLVVTLSNAKIGKKSKTHKVHRLVAQAFIPNPDQLPEINHKDENKKNNVIDNLEWCTTQYNLTYGNRLNCVYGSNNYHSKLTQKQVDEIRRIYIKGDLQFGQSALGKRYGVSHGSIAKIVKGIHWTHRIGG